MRKNGLIAGTLVLTLSSFMTRLFGLVFRVYVSRKLGDVGMGIYQYIMSVYMFLCTFAISGVNVFISSLVAKDIKGLNAVNSKDILNSAKRIMCFTGGMCCLLLFGFSDVVGNVIIKNKETISSLKVLAPSLLFVALSSVYKGYFIGKSKTLIPASASVFEQIIRISVTVILLMFTKNQSLGNLCFLVCLGEMIGEVFSLLYLNAFYNEKKSVKNKPKKLTKRIILSSFPIAINSYTNSGFKLVENLLIPKCLLMFGMSYENAIGTFGMLKGMVMPLLFFPSSLLSALSTSLIPAVSSAKATKNTYRINQTVSKVLKTTLLCSILIVTVFLTYSYELGSVIYNSSKVGELFKKLAIICPFLYLEMVDLLDEINK